MSEPRTEAGRLALKHRSPVGMVDDDLLNSIIAIEREARADLAAAIVAAVGDLEPKLGYEGIVWVGYDAVLDAIREVSDDRRA